MKAAKFLLFLFAVAGIAGMFLPAFQFTAGNQGAVQVMKGGTFFDVLSNIDFDNEAAPYSAGLAGAFVLVLIVSLMSMMGRFNPLMGLLSIAFGGAGGWMWWTLMGDAMMGSLPLVSLGMGGWMMMASPVGGVLFGLMGLVKPEPKDDDKKKDKKKDKK